MAGARSRWRSGSRLEDGATSGWMLACWSGGLEGEHSRWRSGGRQDGGATSGWPPGTAALQVTPARYGKNT
ncbi:MAG TPA: hypothetical protein VH599_16555 [Ktedonobacterales bacterium]